MPFFKSRKRTLVTVLVLFLGMAGFWFYEALYGSTTEALRRAENFLFSRMTVAQLGEQGTMRYFFVTNRQKDSDEGPLEQRFGAERSEAERCEGQPRDGPEVVHRSHRGVSQPSRLATENRVIRLLERIRSAHANWERVHSP